MKLLLQTFLLVLLVINASAQEMQNIEVELVEYVWDRPSGDDRIVLARDSVYQNVLKRSFMKAIADKWNVVVPSFDVKLGKLSGFRTQPKFRTEISNADTSKSYLFVQFFDTYIPINQNNPFFTARINVRYRLIKSGAAIDDKSVSYKVLRRNAAPGQIPITRYPFHPSQFKYLCDTIATTILNDELSSEREIWMDPACGYVQQQIAGNIIENKFHFAGGRQSIEVSGENGFTITQDSVKDVQTGKKRHGAGNTAGSLLTFFSNIDTDKKRSTLHTADHSFSEGSTSYHAYISYVDTKVAERRRVKDEDGMKSIEVGEYNQGWKEINPFAKHVITMNGDTVCLFNMQFRLKENRYDKMWDGQDSSTVDSLPAAFNNFARFEMEMKGTIDENQFVLMTSGEGQIKKIQWNDEDAFWFYSNTGAEGLIAYRHLNERQLKTLTLICWLSDKYYHYK
jgi:hypothetical protein